MSDLFQEPADATPLAPAEREGLRQSWITHRRDLNEAEQENIVKGARWARHRRGSIRGLLTDRFVLELHRRILGEVWKWAGTYRQTERNLGIEPYRIPVEVRTLLDDVRFGSTMGHTRPMRSPCACTTAWLQCNLLPTATAGTRASSRT